MMGSIISVTKRLAARSEIEGAIRALSDHRNFIASELLASAAIDVIAGVSKGTAVETLSDQFESMIRPERRAEVRKLMRKPYNFIKHSDRDKDTAIDRYDTEAAVLRVFTAIIDYESCWRTKTFTMLVFLSWLFCRYPTLLSEKSQHLSKPFATYFGDIQILNQSEALAVLGKAFQQFDGVADEVVAKFTQSEAIER